MCFSVGMSIMLWQEKKKQAGLEVKTDCSHVSHFHVSKLRWRSESLMSAYSTDSFEAQITGSKRVLLKLVNVANISGFILSSQREDLLPYIEPCLLLLGDCALRISKRLGHRLSYLAAQCLDG